MKKLTTGNKPEPIQPTAVFTAEEWANEKRAQAFRDIYNNGFQVNPNVSNLWAEELRKYTWRRPNE